VRVNESEQKKNGPLCLLPPTPLFPPPPRRTKTPPDHAPHPPVGRLRRGPLSTRRRGRARRLPRPQTLRARLRTPDRRVRIWQRAESVRGRGDSVRGRGLCRACGRLEGGREEGVCSSVGAARRGVEGESGAHVRATVSLRVASPRRARQRGSRCQHTSSHCPGMEQRTI